jgi:hypothetical protein
MCASTSSVRSSLAPHSPSLALAQDQAVLFLGNDHVVDTRSEYLEAGD